MPPEGTRLCSVRIMYRDSSPKPFTNLLVQKNRSKFTQTIKPLYRVNPAVCKEPQAGPLLLLSDLGDRLCGTCAGYSPRSNDPMQSGFLWVSSSCIYSIAQIPDHRGYSHQNPQGCYRWFQPKVEYRQEHGAVIALIPLMLQVLQHNIRVSTSDDCYITVALLARTIADSPSLDTFGT